MRLTSLLLTTLMLLTTACATSQTRSAPTQATASSPSPSTPTTSSGTTTCYPLSDDAPEQWRGSHVVPVEGALLDGRIYRAPGYWVSTEGLALLKETGEGCGEKLRVVEQVEVRQGMRPLDVVLVGAGALVVGAGLGVAGGVVLSR